MTQTEMKYFIRKMIKEELYSILPGLLKEAITDVLVSGESQKAPKKNRTVSKTSLLESRNARERFKEKLGLNDFGSDFNTNAIDLQDSPTTLSGINGEPVDSDAVSPELIKSLTRDYTPLMKKLKERR